VAVRFVTKGTHTGPGLGTEPTHRPVEFSGIGMGRISNGQWVEGWNTIDFLTLNKQIGGTLRIG
jgi:predicted ester cyclase